MLRLALEALPVILGSGGQSGLNSEFQSCLGYRVRPLTHSSRLHAPPPKNIFNWALFVWEQQSKIKTFRGWCWHSLHIRGSANWWRFGKNRVHAATGFSRAQAKDGIGRPLKPFHKFSLVVGSRESRYLSVKLMYPRPFGLCPVKCSFSRSRLCRQDCMLGQYSPE